MKKFRRKILALFVLAGVMAPYSALAGEPDPMAGFTKLAKSISKSTNGKVNISGYFNGHYMVHDGAPKFVGKNINKPLYQLREASIFADVNLSDNLLFSTEMETSVDFSAKSTSGRDDRVKVAFNYYYFDFDLASAADWDTDSYGNLSIRAGRLLVPFLSYNENKPSFKQVLMSQPFTAQMLSPVNNVAASFNRFGWTDVGASVNWSYIVGDSGLFDVKLSIINGLFSEGPALDGNSAQLITGPTVRPRDGLFANKSEWDQFSDNNSNKAIVAKVSYAPFSMPLDVGVSYYTGAWDNAGSQNLSMYGFHMNYLEKNWTLKGEYVKANVEQVPGINPVTAPGPAALNQTTGNYNMMSWYVEGSVIPFRYGDEDARFLRMIARYDDVDTNNQAMFNPFDRSRVTLGLEWGFLNNIRARYEWQSHSIDNFANAPAPFIAAGGDQKIKMNMLSLISYF